MRSFHLWLAGSEAGQQQKDTAKKTAQLLVSWEAEQGEGLAKGQRIHFSEPGASSVKCGSLWSDLLGAEQI